MLQGARDRPPAVSVHLSAGGDAFVEPRFAVVPVKPVHVSALMDFVEDAG